MRLIAMLEGPVGDALGVLAGVVAYGAIGAAQDPRDPIGLWCGQVCLAVVIGFTVYAGWRAWVAGFGRV